MKKQVISSIILMMLTFILGLSNGVLATNQTVVNEDTPTTSEVTNVPTSESNQMANNTEWIGTNKIPTDYINNVNDQLQNIASKQQPKDMRRQVAVTVIIIITVLLIVGLITWYYMTNQ